MKKTKILCTIGPASWDEKTLTAMVKAGMNIARINGAFADVAELKRVANVVRSVSKDVALVMDIKGTEVRLNTFKSPMEIKKGDVIHFGTGPSDPIYPVTYPEFHRDLKEGDTIYIDDGQLKFKITKVDYKGFDAKVLVGGILLPGKGINTPGIKLTNPPITPRDIEQIKFAIEDDWDFIASSFVRRKSDIDQVRKYTKGTNVKILAKIENDEGVENIEELIDESDGIIIARGDLAVEMPYEQVPIIQKQIIAQCLLKAKPAIVATQMLESMKTSPVATRAEINDVANAVLDGCDVVWLSAETSTGKYPVEAVETLTRVVTETEKYIQPEVLDTTADMKEITISIAKAVIQICDSLPVDKIVVDTGTGRTARAIASYKPRQPIIAITTNDTFRRQLETTWGVESIHGIMSIKDRDMGIQRVARKAIDSGLVRPKDLIVIVRGTNAGTSTTNTLEVGIASEMAK